MLNSLIALVAKVALGRNILSAVAFINNKLSGNRSEIVAGLIAVIHLLEKFGVLPDGTAVAIDASLLPLLPLVLADRVSKVIKVADKIVP